MRFAFRPRLLASLPGYSRDTFVADLAAGTTVALVALPLALAFAIGSGVAPGQGLTTAIIAGFLISALGGSRVQIGGPAGAFVALLYGIVDRYGVANLLIATIMAGVLLFAMGALRMGTLVRFIPVTIVIGFTNGIAVIIALSQVHDFLGLDIGRMPANFFSQLGALAGNLHTVNWMALILGLLSLLTIVAWPVPKKAREGRWRKLAAKLPSTIIVLVGSGFLVWAFDLDVQTIGTRFGELPRGIPAPHLPEFNWATAQNLLAPTVAIALLCAIESLLCARMADALIHDRHDPNQELMAQGVANFIAPFFGGIAATGTIARTVTNIRTGARTPVSGMIHAVVLLVVVLAAAPLASRVPLAALAAILLWVAFNMGDWKEFRELLRFSLFYRVTLLATFFLTVAFDLVTAVEVGLVLSSLFFIFRVARLSSVQPVALPEAAAHREDGKRVGAWTLFGSLFFASVTKLEALLDPSKPLPDIVILEMHQVINMDNSGLDVLEQLHAELAQKGGQLILAGLNPQPWDLVHRGGLDDVIGRANVVANLDAALERARAA